MGNGSQGTKFLCCRYAIEPCNDCKSCGVIQYDLIRELEVRVYLGACGLGVIMDIFVSL